MLEEASKLAKDFKAAEAAVSKVRRIVMMMMMMMMCIVVNEGMLDRPRQIMREHHCSCKLLKVG